MRPMKVSVLTFYTPCNTHIEIMLEQDNLFYSMNVWENPEEKPTKKTPKHEERLDFASDIIEFTIQNDIKAIAKDWKKHLAEIGIRSCCFNNCADATEWFLEKYGNIPKSSPCSKPISCNYWSCCFFVPVFVPSFLYPGCCTLPGRVADNTRYQLEKKETLSTPLLQQLK